MHANIVVRADTLRRQAPQNASSALQVLFATLRSNQKGHKRSMSVAIDKTTKEIVNAYHDNEFELEEGADSAKDDSLASGL